MSQKPRFELYAFWRTSGTFRVREAFLAINPLGAIPALVEGNPLVHHRPPGRRAAAGRRRRHEGH